MGHSLAQGEETWVTRTQTLLDFHLLRNFEQLADPLWATDLRVLNCSSLSSSLCTLLSLVASVSLELLVIPGPLLSSPELQTYKSPNFLSKLPIHPPHTLDSA